MSGTGELSVVFPGRVPHLKPDMSERTKLFLQAWAINTVAVLVTAHVVSGIDYNKPLDLVVATLLLGFLNAFVRPVLMLLSLPLLLFTLGLFTLVINAGLLLLVGELVKGFHVAGFWAAFKGAILIALINLALNTLTGSGRARVQIRRGRKPKPTSQKRDDNIIDV